ncbi:MULTISPECIES: nuclear transport factor 2 family protein [Niastella]|uniref:Nuclear transport factor 2 family protein n=1 Tax=Niastella soli TaxID=2821487 RepID=A0ABS3YLG2_9BACT|nr:nuclear transport factor 2 family protein [Niastella soli]MBO9198684.1 nuclear transport factor 2 family protein [Niastella soli]
MKIITTFFLFAFVFSGTTVSAQGQQQAPPYKPESKELYDSIVHMDSVWEDSYNNCRLDVQEQIISDDLEFYHDRSGVMKSKKALIEALKNNICGKVTRELLKGSIEVYPIKNYGAVEMGYHRFRNKNDTGDSQYARFIHIWHHENGQWKITRVISLH